MATKYNQPKPQTLQKKSKKTKRPKRPIDWNFKKRSTTLLLQFEKEYNKHRY